MDLNPTTVIVYEDPDGERYTLAGPRAGDRGIHLATGLEGFYDPPVEVVDESMGTYPGSRYVAHRFLRREIVFGVEILNDSGSKSWLRRDSMWRKSWSFNRPGKLYVTRPESGTRWIKVQLLEQPQTPMDTDPNMQSIIRCTMVVVAYDPFWYEDPIQFDLETQTDTTVSGTEDLTFDIGPGDGKSGGLNPTDQDINVIWALEGTGKYTVPDYSWDNPAQADRRIILPQIEVADGNLLVNTSRRVEQTSTSTNTPFWNRMNGVRWLNKVPKYTESKEFVVTASKTPPGRTVTLFLPRPWSRPWGLE